MLLKEAVNSTKDELALMLLRNVMTSIKDELTLMLSYQCYANNNDDDDDTN